MTRLDVPEPWRANVSASLKLIDDLERQITEVNRRLKDGHADLPYIPLFTRPFAEQARPRWASDPGTPGG